MALAPLTGVGDAAAFARFNEMISYLNALGITNVAGLADALTSKAARSDIAIASGRPGESPWLFTTSLSGAPEAAVALGSGTVEALDGIGRVLTVAGESSIGSMQRHPLKAAVKRQLFWDVQRKSVSSDPAGDTVELRIKFLNASFSAVSDVAQFSSILAAGERFTRSCVISSEAGAGVDRVWPATAVYAVPYVRTYNAATTTALIEIANRLFSDVTTPEQMATIAQAVSDVQSDLDATNASLKSVRQRNLGAFATDADANAYATANGLTRTTETRYFNTASNQEKIWSGAAWVLVGAGNMNTATYDADGTLLFKQMQRGTSPFGSTGFKILTGEAYDAHCGFGGIVEFTSGKWVHIYRKASSHAIKNDAQLRARDSYDKGETWSNDRLIISTGTHDLRPDAPRRMGNNRGGFFVNRQTEGSTGNYPWFFKSDDEGVTWTYAVVNTASTIYTFQGHSGLVDWPASKGGHDTQGFVSYGYVGAGGLGAFKTSNNGDTWTYVLNCAIISGALTAISETSVVYVPALGKYIAGSRGQDSGGWKQTMTLWITDDPFNFGSWIDSHLDLYGNPPCLFLDPTKTKLNVVNPARGGRGFNGYENEAMWAQAGISALIAANGDFSALGIGYQPLAPIPGWSTWYLAPFYSADGRCFGAFTCGEPGTSGGERAITALMGNFVPNASELFRWFDWLTRRVTNRRSAQYVADDNLTTSYTVTYYNASKTGYTQIGAYGLNAYTGTLPYIQKYNTSLVFDVPAVLLGGLTAGISGVTASVQGQVGGSTAPVIATYAPSNTSRSHWDLYGGSASPVKVGSISTTNTATTYATSSDYRLKIDVTLLVNATARLLMLKPRRFAMTAKPEERLDGFLAHEVSPVVPGAVVGRKDAMRDVGTLSIEIGDLRSNTGNTLIEQGVPQPDVLLEEETWTPTGLREINVHVPRPDELAQGMIWEKTGEEPDFQQLDHSKLVPLLVAALQETIARTVAAEMRLQALEDRTSSAA